MNSFKVFQQDQRVIKSGIHVASKTFAFNRPNSYEKFLPITAAILTPNALEAVDGVLLPHPSQEIDQGDEAS